MFHGLEPTKPLVTKLQKRNQDIYQAYCMIDKVLSDLGDTFNQILIMNLKCGLLWQ